jgi:SAM-dependent methyltransferase
MQEGWIKDMVATLLPPTTRRWMRTGWNWLTQRPRIGSVEFGSLGRLTPISQKFGFDRGLCIDRYYIERFLAGYGDDIQGRVLEMGDNDYSVKFGQKRVERSDVLHLDDSNPKATIVGDLTKANTLPPETFDCIIVTQTLQFVYDVRSAVKQLARSLKNDGVLLATFPGISQISRYDMDRWGEYWRFTSLSARRIFEEFFPSAEVTTKTYGNVLVSVAFLHGVAAKELRDEDLDHVDPDYELLIGVRAAKPIR